jgi:Response regulator containing CheY-like receiver, AAA-type ATPase, and DNA-binding domains
MSTPTENITSVLLETVLVLDNDVLVRMPICEYLRDCGYRVLEAANADEAKAILEKRDIKIDVLLSDIQMPGHMNGFAFVAWARSMRPGLVIVIAGTPERAANAAGELCEHGPILGRPYEPQTVLQRIKRLLAARSAELARE